MYRLLGLLICLSTPALAESPPVRVIDLLELRTDDVDSWERLHRTSDSAPLTLDELEKLAAAGVGQKTLLELMRTRRVMVVADADALLRLKKAGATDDMLSAVSAHALPPNTHFDLSIRLQVASPGAVGRAPHLYIEVFHEDAQRQETLMHADLRSLIAGRRGVDVARDNSDPLLPRTVRAVNFKSRVETRKPGKLTVRVLATQSAGLTSLRGLPPAETKRIRTHVIDYPGVSLDRRCRLDLTLQRDAVMTDVFAIERDAIECRWD